MDGVYKEMLNDEKNMAKDLDKLNRSQFSKKYAESDDKYAGEEYYDVAHKLPKKDISDVLKVTIAKSDHDINQSIKGITKNPKLRQKLHKMSFKMRKDYRSPSSTDSISHFIFSDRKIKNDAKKPGKYIMEHHDPTAVKSGDKPQQYIFNANSIKALSNVKNLENAIYLRTTSTQALKHLNHYRLDIDYKSGIGQLKDAISPKDYKHYLKQYNKKHQSHKPHIHQLSFANMKPHKSNHHLSTMHRSDPTIG